MADYVVSEKPVFSETMRKLNTTDRGHAAIFNERYQALFDNDNYLKHRELRHYITLPASDWGTEAPYVQTAELSGASAADVPVIGLSLTGSTATDRKAEKKAWSCVDKAVAGDGVITFTCYDKVPTVDITVIVKGVG